MWKRSAEKAGAGDFAEAGAAALTWKVEAEKASRGLRPTLPPHSLAPLTPKPEPEPSDPRPDSYPKPLPATLFHPKHRPQLAPMPPTTEHQPQANHEATRWRELTRKADDSLSAKQDEALHYRTQFEAMRLQAGQVHMCICIRMVHPYVLVDLSSPPPAVDYITRMCMCSHVSCSCACACHVHVHVHVHVAACACHVHVHVACACACACACAFA